MPSFPNARSTVETSATPASSMSTAGLRPPLPPRIACTLHWTRAGSLWLLWRRISYRFHTVSVRVRTGRSRVPSGVLLLRRGLGCGPGSVIGVAGIALDERVRPGGGLRRVVVRGDLPREVHRARVGAGRGEARRDRAGGGNGADEMPHGARDRANVSIERRARDAERDRTGVLRSARFTAAPRAAERRTHFFFFGVFVGGTAR